MKATHYSQLYDLGDGRGLNGQNDCWDGALARYLDESGFPWTGDHHSLIAHVRLLTSNQQTEYGGQPYTTVAQATAYLERCGLPYRISTDPRSALRPWTLCLVHGMRLRPAQYPASWFGSVDDPDHFILTLPGGPNLVNDPLAFWNGQEDCVYDQAALLNAAQGGLFYEMPDPLTIAWTGTVASLIVPKTLAGCVMTTDQHLRPYPATLPAGGPLAVAGTRVGIALPQEGYGTITTHWIRVTLPAGGGVGWALRTNETEIYTH